MLLLPLVLAGSAWAQGNNAPPAVTTTDAATTTTAAGQSRMSARSELKLAKAYTADEFFNEWDFFSDADPTNGYVNYVSKADSQNLGLASKLSDGSFIMRADAENRSVGRGRNSVRISSKAKFGDGVYILDMNHMPVGCGTWPAWWTVVKDGWPKGGEIDIIEGANAYPSLRSASYNATSGVGLKTPAAGYPTTQDVASLHVASSCNLDPNAYMTGTVGSTTCSAYQNGNTGCGAYLGGKSTYGTTSFGSGVNEAGGGWFAMWRDIEASGGVYVYYWPRNASNVPDDVRYPNTSTTNVADWGQPGANLSVPTCKNDFGNHVIVINLAFCGDYAGNTYAQSGCPQICTSFVQNYPEAFGEAYWSINSLRVYTTSGKPAAGGGGLSGGAIAGIVVGVLAALALAAVGFWWWKRSRGAKKRKSDADQFLNAEPMPPPRKYSTAWAGADVDESTDPMLEPQLFPRKKHSAGSSTSGETIAPSSAPERRTKAKKGEVRLATKKPRTGKTVLRPGMTASSYLDGETPLGGENPPAEGFVMKPQQPQQPHQRSWVG